MKQKTILVAGGAGYIGSHMLRLLRNADYRIIVLDNFNNGHRQAVQGFACVEVDLLDHAKLVALFKKEKIDAVIHFSALIEVGQSVKDPQLYYFNNLVGTINLLQVMLAHDIKHFVFSSTAAVYGEPQYTPIDEQHIIAPINPYGRSKAMVEQLLADYAHAYGLNYTVLRYFNAAGAHPNGEIGECHEPESHLIPNILTSILEKTGPLKIFGDDFDTPDGTCIRDYIHVMDLCQAHLLALQQLFSYGGSYHYNLGNGKGFSVKEVIKSAENVIKQPIPYQVHARRPGDPAILIANSRLIQNELGWKPHYHNLEVIIGHAWFFLKNRMNNLRKTG